MHISEPENLNPGDRVADYLIERLVGRGAMAVVYRAIQVNLERPTALKILPSELAGDKDFVNRFFNEAKAAAVFSHPNIVQAYDAGVDDNGICYFAMEFVEGETLLDRIEHGKKIPPLPAVRIALDIARALAYGWKHQRLTHGDIKPANIMLTTRDETKLADFGLAKVSGLDTADEDVMLTPLYAAPEVIRSQVTPPDCRPDIYSLGATLYHMVTGAPPFPGDDSREVMRAQVEDPLVPANQKNPDLPKPVSDLLDRLLRKSPEERPQTWAAVIRALEKLAGSLSRTAVVAKPTASPGPHFHVAKSGSDAPSRQFPGAPVLRQTPRRRRKRRQVGRGALWACVLALIAVYVILWLWYMSQRRQAEVPDRSIAQEDAQHERQRMQVWQRARSRISNMENPSERLLFLQVLAEEYPPIEDLPEFNEHLRFAQAEVAEQRQDALDNGSDTDAEPAATDPDAPFDADPDEDRLGVDEPVDDDLTATAPDTPLEDLGDDVLRAWHDAYVQLLYDIRNYRFSLDKPVAPLKTMVADWLAACPRQVDVRQRASFIADVVLPALGELRAALMHHSESIRGLTIPGVQGTVHDVTRNGLRMTVLIDAGEERGTASIINDLSWAQVSSPRQTVELVVHALRESTAPAKHLEPFFAFFTVSGAGGRLRNALAERDLLGEPTYRMWALVAEDLGAAGREHEALDMLRQARRLYQEDRHLEAFHLSKDLQALQTAVTTRHAQAIEQLQQQTRERAPSYRVDRLISQAADAIETEPGRGLEILTVANVRYGRFDPGVAQTLERIRGRALDGLAETVAMPDGAPEKIDTVLPFMDFADADTGWQAALKWLELEHLNRQLEPMAPSLRGFAVFEVGDWAQGMAAVRALPSAEERRLREPLRVSALHNRGLTAWRLSSPREQVEVLNTLETLWLRRTSDPAVRNAAAAAACELALIFEQYEAAAKLNWPDIQELVPAVPPRQIKRYILGRLALLVHAGEHVAALALAGQVRGEGETFADFGFTSREWGAVRALLARLNDAPDIPEWVPRTMSHDYPALLERLAFAVALRVDGRDEPAAVARVWRPDNLHGRCHVFGKTRSAVFFLRLALSMEAGDIEAMTALIGNALAWQDAAAAAYYPRLIILRAGTEIMAGRVHAAQESLKLLDYMTVANDGERNLAGFLGDLRKASHLPSQVPNAPEAAYWEAYLKVSYWISQDELGQAENHAKFMQACSRTLEEKELAKALRTFVGAANRAAAR